MRLSIIIPAALVGAPLAVLAAGTLGFCLGNTNADGSCKMQSDYEADFDALKGVSRVVRTYTSGGTCATAQQILPAAVAKGFQVVLGVWPDTQASYTADKSALQSALSNSQNAGAVYAITVGSEALYRGSLTPQELLSYIQDMQNTFPNVKIGTADSWNKFQDGTADPIVSSGIKLILANAFSYWQGQTLQNSSHSYLDDLNQAYARVQSVAGNLDTEIWNGEVGWPSDGGTSYQNAMAGTQNAATFFQQGVCAALNWGFNVFYFEAFDEPSKPPIPTYAWLLSIVQEILHSRHRNHTSSRRATLSFDSQRALDRPLTFVAVEGLNWLSSSPASHPKATSFRPQNPRVSTCIDPPTSYPVSRSRSSSVWTAPSPSQAIQAQSPSPPSLPRRSSHTPYLQTFESPGQHQRSDSSAYYTALWGSPYDLPSSAKAQVGGHRHQKTRSTITADGSPSRTVRAGVVRGSRSVANNIGQIGYNAISESALISRTSGLYSLPVRSISINNKPRYGFTQEWLRDHLTLRRSDERGNWWSDESGASDIEAGEAPRKSLERGSREHLGTSPHDKNTDQKAEEITSNSQNTTFLNIQLPRSETAARHRAVASEVTSKQKDFDRTSRGSHEKQVETAVLETSQSDKPENMPTLDSTNDDASVAFKPPPPPPPSRTMSEAPILTRAVSSDTSGSSVKRPSLSSLTSFQRPRKRVVWRGKNCVIALPLQDGNSNPKKYLTPDDAEARVVEWQRQGFNTRGFNLSEQTDVEDLGLGQSRDIFPDPRSWLNEWREKNYRVSIPDRKAWDEYVNQMKEEKLRALGVSFGDDDRGPAIKSDHLMSTQLTSQTSMLPPPLPLIPSNASAKSRSDHDFSPLLSDSASPFNRPALISTIPQQYSGTLGRPHMPNQSFSMNGQLSGAPVYFSSQQPAPPASNAWSQQQYHGSLPGSRRVSPHMSGRRQSLYETQSPVYPMPDMAFDGYSTTHNNTNQVQQQQTRPYSSFLPYQYQSTPAANIDSHYSNPLKSRQDQANVLHPASYISQPDIASPLPQGHRQNLSESLQKEIDNAEYHLEESIRRQLDEDDELSLHSTPNDGSPLYPLQGSISTNTLRNMRPTTMTTMSDLDTNPSISGSPVLPGRDTQQNHSGSARPNHAPKASVSKLNINAREFVYDPQSSITPSMYSFLGSSAASRSVPQVGTPESQVPSYVNGYSSGTKLNIAAPTFTPGGVQKMAVPLQEFSFSSSMPRLKPDAPSFMPSSVKQIPASTSDQSGTDKPPFRMFGNLDFSAVLKPDKKSKAIPIVNPHTLIGDGESDNELDDTGRFTRSRGRDKRMRRTDDDDDHIPLFATPHDDLPAKITAKEIIWQDQIVVEPDTPSARVITYDLEKTLPNHADERIKEVEVSYSSEFSGSSNITDGYDGKINNGNHENPFEFNDAVEAVSFDVARPMSSKSSHSRTSDNKSIDEAKHMDISGNDDHKSPGHSSQSSERISLSATVQPLEYNADAATYQSETEAITPSDERRWTNGNSLDSRNAENARLREDIVQPCANGIPQRNDTSSSARSSAIARGDIVYAEPSFQEIDAVMKHLNEDSDAGVERLRAMETAHSPRRSPARSTGRSLELEHGGLSDSDRHLYAQVSRNFPSSSPNRLQQPFQYLPQRSYGSSDSAAAELVARSARYSPSFKPSKPPSSNPDASIHRVNSVTNMPLGELDDAVSSTEEAKFQSRSDHFDHRVNDLVGTIVQQKLKPLEDNLFQMGNLLAQLVNESGSRRSRRSVSVEAKDSDADDEDEDEDEEIAQSRARSPLKDKKYDKLKAMLLEAIAAQQISTPTEEITTIKETLAELKVTIGEQKTSPMGEMKAIVEEAINRHMRGKSAPIVSSHQSATSERYQLQITGLESMLKISQDRAEDDLKARRVAEDELADCQRLLRLAQADAAEQRESAEETERSLGEFHDERLQTMQRSTLLEVAQEDLQKNIAELSAKNVALNDTLEEYRLSSAQWRQEIDEAKTTNNNLDRTIHALKAEIEDGIGGRQILRDKFSSLQDEMVMASRDIARDQSSWRYKEEEHKARHEWQNTRLEAEARTRERLELEIQRLESQEKEAMKSRYFVEQVQRENGRLTALVNELTLEGDQAKKDTARYQRELHDAKETGRLDILRVQKAIEADTEKATHGIHIIRKDLESVIARLQTQLEDAKTDAADLKARYELMLEEASESRDEAFRLAAEAREAALQEHYAFHQRTLTEAKALHDRALAVALENKDNALKNVVEDKKLTETSLKHRLKLADEKIFHYEDRIMHLEEKFDIAKSAAQAAVQAAQSARASPNLFASRGSVSVSRGSDVDGKISPQALRESILVLQEQLHERESQIEKLEQEAAKFDIDAPTKIRDRDIEIAWLRELLGVRTDDLQDIITTLSGSQTYDREAVRDAAIRLKANLQMEQQEKERAIAGGQVFPSLASITSFTASPRALPLAAAAAAAAWGNWRKGQSTFASLSEMAMGSASQTPSKSSPQSFLSGLLTPPSTNLRQTPQPPGSSTASRSTSAEYRPLRGYSTPRQSTSRLGLDRSFTDQPPPETPQLLRKASYDQDAQSGHYSLERYVAEDDESTADRNVNAEREEEPFGPSIAT
ncbi:hypothetical protein MMC13_004370 [Lambiella insularis]|nr:hypothetical protein [Lambiella insularis]